MKISSLNKQQKIIVFIIMPSILIFTIIAAHIIFPNNKETSSFNTNINTSLPKTTENIQGQKTKAYKQEETIGEKKKKSDFVLGDYEILNENNSKEDSEERLNETREKLIQERETLESFDPDTPYDDKVLENAKKKHKSKNVIPEIHPTPQPQGITFNSITVKNSSKINSTTSGGILSYIHGDQTITSGSLVKIRIGKDITLPSGEKIPAKSFVYGVCAFTKERLNIKITQVQINNNLIKCNLIAYGTDGNPGIYVPGSIQRQENKKSSSKGLKNIGNALGSGVSVAAGGIIGNVAETTTKGMIEAVADGSAKAVAETKIFLPNNERIYLK